jgi:hypothetical protein
MRELAGKVGDRILVEKSPYTVRRVECMQRIRQAFPGARFIHLLRHPRTQGVSLCEMGERHSRTPLGAAYELGAIDFSAAPPSIDMQKVWYTLHMNVLTFLETLPKEQWLRFRGEDLLSNPDPYLAEIAEWLGLRTDKEAIKEMKHPERSPFASIGPINAPFGNDGKFLRDPRLRPLSKRKPPSLEGPMEWSEDGKGFSPEVIRLAMEFGYA